MAENVNPEESKISLEDLNSNQQDAVTTRGGPLLIYAGAGSGKTRVLSYRIAWLIEERLAKGWEIWAVTFTRKAALEMKGRAEKLLGQKNTGVFLGTFHAFGSQFLKEYQNHKLIGRGRFFTIYDSDDQGKLISDVAKELDINLKAQFMTPGLIREAISRWKDELIGPLEALSTKENHLGLSPEQLGAVRKIYERYEKRLLLSNALDFGDLIMYPCKILQENKEILNQYQERYRWLLVDEYQDTNHAQYVLTKLLADKYHNITVVGDDSQSIFRFRGADIRNILDFKKDYPESKVVTLEENYRSHQSILDVATNVIANNSSYVDKKLWSKKKHGPKIKVIESYNSDAEGEVVAFEIENLKDREKIDYEEMAVLYRIHALSRALEQQLNRRGIPYHIVGGVKFFDRLEIKDTISYLRLLYNPADLQAFIRAIGAPRRGIGAKIVQKLIEKSMESGKALLDICLSEEVAGLSKVQMKKVKEFALLVEKLKSNLLTHKLSSFIDFMWKEIGYREYVLESLKEGEERLENLNELLNLATNWDDVPAEEGLTSLLENASLLSLPEEVEEEARKGVTLTTVHAAKGLEFLAVFIIGLEEGTFPHSRSIGNVEEIEEERRLAYVALTRAKEHLYLSHVRYRQLYGQDRGMATPSRFLEEIPEKLLTMYIVPQFLREGNFFKKKSRFREEDWE